ncbi:FUSC family protein [Alteribacter aurantiacus]|uniref:FUSC family protein n=1 Tax=Alteribacter aurantiacus TaxID=254410 RepID=UPI0004074FA9|nr:aromatic acid exporter family protein [Alteribacter aurantiacus]
MRLGARILKTGLAVVMALYIATWLGFDTPVYAALAAVFAVQPSVYRSFMTILDQLQANVISAVLAVVFVLSFGHDPFVVGVVVVLIIAINLKLGKESIIPLAVVTAIIIMEAPSEDFISFASSRFLLIMIGVASSFIVNLIFLPPKHENHLFHKITAANEQIIQWIRLMTRHEAEYNTLKQDLKKLKDTMIKMDNIFLLYKDERTYFKKNEYPRMRKVVLFRQMLYSTKKCLDILRSLSKHENSMQQMPDELQDLLRAQLDYLTNYHERIMLKYMGKVRPHTTEDLYEEVDIGKRQLTDAFFNLHEDKNIERSEWIHFFPVVALVVEYSEELEHLDRLVDSFFKFHKDDNEVNVLERRD